MKFEECGECNIKFHNIGTLPARKRLIHHRRIEHRAECENCGKKFEQLVIEIVCGQYISPRPSSLFTG